MSKQTLLILVLCLGYQINLATCEETVELTIPDGTIRGQVNSTVRENVTFYSFRGIPYAQPPVGNLRFASPVKNSAWSGVYNATYDRSECYQNADGYLGFTFAGQEDCLYINVYTPDVNATGLPVLVWIHGGTFLLYNSSYAKFAPDFFLEQDLVFVSFNYRMGVFGFLSTEDEACPGNWGIKDQLLALQWVQDNVAYFGGDPNNVTISGESAGSVSVHLLLQTNRTTGLFQRAIMCSGTSLNLWGLNTRAASTATLLGVNLGIITTNTTELVESLREIEVEELYRVSWSSAVSLFLGNGLRGLPYAPVIEPDIEGAVYTKASETALEEGNFQQVPILMGFNSEEAVGAESLTSLIKIYLLYYDVAIAHLTPWSFTQVETTRYLAGADIKYEYFQLESIAADTHKLIKFVSADQFNRPIRKAASLMANYTTVYFYEFGYQGTVSADGDREYEGTGHAEDLSYYFVADSNYTATDLKVSETMVLLWSNFAKYGNPTPEEDEKFNNTIWEPIDSTDSDLIYLSFNESIVMATNPKQADWEYYERVYAKYGDDSDEITTY
uniref:Carboxylic ester hydrolase n=2 Tax=Dendroctonus ponderosae TaxID=77166 RepID=J3JWZ8_DENPD|nr:unknown [Dendroctonus ponderosae]